MVRPWYGEGAALYGDFAIIGLSRPEIGLHSM